MLIMRWYRYWQSRLSLELMPEERNQQAKAASTLYWRHAVDETQGRTCSIFLPSAASKQLPHHFSAQPDVECFFDAISAPSLGMVSDEILPGSAPSILKRSRPDALLVLVRIVVSCLVLNPSGFFASASVSETAACLRRAGDTRITACDPGRRHVRDQSK